MLNNNIDVRNVYTPDIVVVGGGPIGLWTAIQTKLRTQKDILIVEKYNEYKRADIRLNIRASSFNGIAGYEPLRILAQKWGNRLVPIKEIEDELTKCAHNLGISILKGKAADPKLLKEQYPTARMFIGADGARSTVRKEIFDDQYKFNIPLQYIAQVQYMIKTPEDENEDCFKSGAKSYSKQKFAGHLITQNIRPQNNGQSQVTLRIFINQKTYKEMADATFSNPYYFEKDLHKVPLRLQDTLIKWWGTQHNQSILVDKDKPNKISVIPLNSYASKQVYKVDDDQQVAYLLVGDASQAYPFFRAVNNGLLIGTKLAQDISKAFTTLDKAQENVLPSVGPQSNKLVASSFKSYARYSAKRAYIECIKSLAKNLFIVLSNYWIKISNCVPWQTIKLKKEEKIKAYECGVEIWKELSGADPSPRLVTNEWLK